MIKFLLQRPIAVLMAFTACFIVGLVTYFTVSAVAFQCQIQAEYGNISGTGFDYPWTFYFTWQVVHSCVYLFVDFDKSQIRICSEIEV